MWQHYTFSLHLLENIWIALIYNPNILQQVNKCVFMYIVCVMHIHMYICMVSCMGAHVCMITHAHCVYSCGSWPSSLITLYFTYLGRKIELESEPDNLATLAGHLAPGLLPPFLSTGIAGHGLPDTLPGFWESRLQPRHLLSMCFIQHTISC